MPMNIAIAGSEELISETLLEMLQERNFPVAQLFLLTALDAEDQDSVRFNSQDVYVQSIGNFDWSQAELVFFAGNGEDYLSAFNAAEQQGCKIIDLRSAEFKTANYGLSLPAQNEDMGAAVHTCPEDLTIIIANMIHPFFEETAISELKIVTLEPVSGYGKKGTEALAKEIAQLMNGRPVENAQFSAQLAFNTVPVDKNAVCLQELQKLYPAEKLHPVISSLLVPVFFGTTVIVDIMLEDALPKEDIIRMLSSRDEVQLSEELLTPVTHGSNQSKVSMQVTMDDTNGNTDIHSFRVMLVADLLRSGKISNAILLAEQFGRPIVH